MSALGELRGHDAIFWDFDGVLARSVSVKTESFAAMYEGRGDEVVAWVVDYHLANGGVSRFDKFRHWERELTGADPAPERIAELAGRFSSLVKDRVVAAPAVPGAMEALRALVGECPMFVVTGTPTAEATEIVQRRGMTSFFREVCGSPDTKDIILARLIDRYGLAAERTIMVGDARSDYRGSVAVGSKFLGVGGADHPFPPGTRVLPDLT